MDGKHGVERAAEVLGNYREVDLDITGLQETRFDDILKRACTCGDKDGGKKDQGRVGLVVRETMTRAVVRQP